jgi:hypothetical protein
MIIFRTIPERCFNPAGWLSRTLRLAASRKRLDQRKKKPRFCQGPRHWAKPCEPGRVGDRALEPVTPTLSSDSFSSQKLPVSIGNYEHNRLWADCNLDCVLSHVVLRIRG